MSIGMLKEKCRSAVAPLAVVGSAMMPAVAFASETGSAASTMQSAFTTVQSDFMATVTAVAPIAVGIAGTFLVWRLGVRFFKSIAK